MRHSHGVEDAAMCWKPDPFDAIKWSIGLPFLQATG